MIGSRPRNLRTTTTLVGAFLMLMFLGGTKAMAIEESGYEVVRTFPDFELRRYPPYRVAETEVPGPFDEAGNQAFRILADYIFGNNRADTKIEMTAPVSQRPAAGEGERIEMAAPVAQRPASGTDGGTFIVSFVMPERFTLATLPVPVDPRVRLREEPGKLVAVRRYSGRWTESSYRENESLLLSAVEQAGLRPVAAPVYARYNSPFSLWFMRRNEVMVEVGASGANP
ncbi:heme-binding protein [Thiocapsa sp.]|uniref:SOUL family heme-binding protein n=1 Tax=Thiocapsa sp. TaxID=2024551 RepID=UPI0035944993